MHPFSCFFLSVIDLVQPLLFDFHTIGTRGVKGLASVFYLGGWGDCCAKCNLRRKTYSFKTYGSFLFSTVVFKMVLKIVSDVLCTWESQATINKNNINLSFAKTWQNVGKTVLFLEHIHVLGCFCLHEWSKLLVMLPTKTDCSQYRSSSDTVQTDCSQYRSSSDTVQTDCSQYRSSSDTVQTDCSQYRSSSDTVQLWLCVHFMPLTETGIYHSSFVLMKKTTITYMKHWYMKHWIYIQAEENLQKEIFMCITWCNIWTCAQNTCRITWKLQPDMDYVIWYPK